MEKHHRHAHRRSLRPDRSQPWRMRQPSKHPRLHRQHRPAHPLHRNRTARCRRQRSRTRTTGRNVDTRPASDERLLEPPRRNGQSTGFARLPCHRRHRRHGRKRLVQTGGPQKRPHRRLRLQRLSERSRRRCRLAPESFRSRLHRRFQPENRRSIETVYSKKRRIADRGRAHRLLPHRADRL